MRFACLGLAFACVLTPVLAQEKTDGPTNEKAQKTYKQALVSLHQHNKIAALESFKKSPRCICKFPGCDTPRWKGARTAAPGR